MPLMAGLVVSTTVTMNEPVETVPSSQLTVVGPSGNGSPDAGTQWKPALSYVTGVLVPVASTLKSPGSACTRADASGVPQRSEGAHRDQPSDPHPRRPPPQELQPPGQDQSKRGCNQKRKSGHRRSTWRSETNTATGRHGTRFAGTSAIAREAIANESAMTMKMDASPWRQATSSGAGCSSRSRLPKPPAGW